MVLIAGIDRINYFVRRFLSWTTERDSKFFRNKSQARYISATERRGPTWLSCDYATFVSPRTVSISRTLTRFFNELEIFIYLLFEADVTSEMPF